MDTITFLDILIFLGSVAAIVLLVLFGVILLYTIRILRSIYELIGLAKKQADGLSVRTDDIKKYLGGSTLIRLVLFFFRRKKLRK
jgi:dolichol kinase